MLFFPQIWILFRMITLLTLSTFLTLLYCQIHNGQIENKRLPLSDIIGSNLSDYMQHPLLPQKASHSITKRAVQDVNC